MAEVNCVSCSRPLDFEDEMANMALRKGNMTQGMCRDCRSAFWANFKKEKENFEN